MQTKKLTVKMLLLMAKIFDHLLNRNLAHVTRYNNRPQHFPESVAEHSFYVSYFTLIICELLEKKKMHVSKEKALKMAIIHDAEEGYSGDILNPFKHYNEKVYQAIKEVDRELIKEVFLDLPESLRVEFINTWSEESKGETAEAQIVKVADKLSLLSKCFEEIQAGNNYFEEIYKLQLSSLKKLDFSWWGKIKEDMLSGADKQP